jgi:hypothetical protein
MPAHQGCQSRLFAAAEVVLQQLPIGQTRSVPQKRRLAQVLEDLAHRVVRHAVSLVGATLTLYLPITRTGPFDAYFCICPAKLSDQLLVMRICVSAASSWLPPCSRPDS